MLSERVVEDELQWPGRCETRNNLGQHRDKNNREPTPIGSKESEYQARHSRIPFQKRNFPPNMAALLAILGFRAQIRNCWAITLCKIGSITLKPRFSFLRHC